MQHYVYILGFEHPVRVTEEEGRTLRNIITGADVVHSFVSLGAEKRTILVRASAITALEARTKAEFSFASVSSR
jgi:hypothetical protein